MQTAQRNTASEGKGTILPATQAFGTEQHETLPNGERSLASEMRERIAEHRMKARRLMERHHEEMRRLHILEHELALLSCPFRPGDQLYLGTDKYRKLERVEVLAVLPPEEGDPGEYALEAFGIRKDGTRAAKVPRRWLSPELLEIYNADLVAARRRGDLIPRLSLRR